MGTYPMENPLQMTMNGCPNGKIWENMGKYGKVIISI
jgi:hypothetical protein